MRLSVIGINHHTAPLEVRERVALAPSAVEETLGRLRSQLHEGVLLSTCNRTELYCVPRDHTDVAASFQVALQSSAPIDQRFLFTSEDGGAARHLFRVASGVDSLVFGETEVLGQVRRAWDLARESGTTGGLTSQLFQMALAVGKRVRSQTGIGRFPASVSSAAVSLAQQVLGRDLGQSTVMVIGTGEVGRGVARVLRKRGAGTLMVANHRPEHGRELAERFSGIAVPWPIPTSFLARADIVISSTMATEPVLRADDVSDAMALRAGAPLHVIDLAVPRDVDSEVAALPNVTLHNLDDIKQVVADSIQRRRLTQPQAETLILEQTGRFDRWLREREVVPTIRDLRTESEAIRMAEMRWALPKLPSLSDREHEVINMLTSRLVNKLLHSPSTRLRMAAADGQVARYREVADDLFGLNSRSADTDEEEPSAG